MRLHPSASALESEVEAYLQRLGRVTPDSTHVSHKSTLNQFTDWYATQRNQRLDETSIVGYATDQISNEHITTTRGRIDTLANFLAYYWQNDPDIVKLRVATSLDSQLPQLAELIRPSEPSAAVSDVAELLIEYLRQYQFGTRVHVFTELLIDTKSRPTVIRRCDATHFDRHDGTITVGIADTHAISDADLSIARTVRLRELTVEALTEYLDYERPDPRTVCGSPLFATSRGRMSASTLRRTIKNVSDDAITVFTPQTSEPTADHHLTPSELWRYAITESTG